MANRIKIAVIGKGLEDRVHAFDQSAVDGMLASWGQHLEPVFYDRPDLVLLPENCDRCWPATATYEQYMQFYETRGDQLRDYMASLSKRHGCHIAFSYRRKVQDGSWRNSLEIVGRKGEVVGVYDKGFPIVPEMDIGVTPGDDFSLIECDFGKVAGAICFDLNFEELRAQYAAQKPDLILFSSVYHGGLMQAYWAYSCRAHFAASVPNLPSAIYNPLGNVLATTTNYTLTVCTEVNLDCRVAHLDNNWGHFNDIKKKYGPDVNIFEPGFLAPVVLSSESDAFTADDIFKEYGIEGLDDYLDRSRDARKVELAGLSQAAPA